MTCISCLTVQDSGNVHRLIPLEAPLIEEQLQCLLNDIPIDAIKLGLLGSEPVIHVVAELLKQHPDIPVVLDPILAAGGGKKLGNQPLIDALRTEILPHTTLITPNSHEARLLSGHKTLDDCADTLIEYGCASVLITGTHEESEEVVHRLYRPGLPSSSHNWPRLEHSYHGSGCTLASAIAAGLAHGLDLEQAVMKGQEFTWHSLSAGWKPGRAQYFPERLYRHGSEY